MAEVIALIMAALLATALAHYVKRWLRPLAGRADTSTWSRRLVIAGMVIAPSFLALVLILGLRALFAYFRLRVELIDIAMDLATFPALPHDSGSVTIPSLVAPASRAAASAFTTSPYCASLSARRNSSRLSRPSKIATSLSLSSGSGISRRER